jgi:hypothetical protein
MRTAEVPSARLFLSKRSLCNSANSASRPTKRELGRNPDGLMKKGAISSL